MEWRVDTRGREENHLNPLTRSIGVFGSVVGGGERRTMVSVGRHWHVSAIRPIIVATSWPTFQYANVRVRALHACLPPNSYPCFYQPIDNRDLQCRRLEPEKTDLYSSNSILQSVYTSDKHPIVAKYFVRNVRNFVWEIFVRRKIIGGIVFLVSFMERKFQSSTSFD